MRKNKYNPYIYTKKDMWGFSKRIPFEEAIGYCVGFYESFSENLEFKKYCGNTEKEFIDFCVSRFRKRLTRKFKKPRKDEKD